MYIETVNSLFFSSVIISKATHLSFVDLASQVRRTAPVRVIGNHHPPVSLFDPRLCQGRLSQPQDLSRLFPVHLGLEAAFHPLAAWFCGARAK